ncbi:Broad-complex core protein isoforms 1/2/3/4/5 [Amphibalanus amphitrite]|uniref:Broad-complex core protein isoforms 1/2/3/4/5 n=1 Tax=Amphibalanus amphitrite TaxID=1232801 RepID=A0A6A4WF50_AMPAM|nr:Broad-complex core protein isoforms 1/2/3/4/5 [Amphibalanus amphitrite]
MDSQKFCLKWDGFQGSVTSVFDHLRADSELVDVTLCCEGQRVRAHRMMLSACSPYFRELFKGAVKVEKFDVDLTLDDDEDTTGAGDELEAALGNVAQYEGYDPGSDQSLSADGHMFGAGGSGEGSMGGAAGGPYTPGTSQRAGEDGSQGFSRQSVFCSICGAGYSSHGTLQKHMKMHTGGTVCPVCKQIFSMTSARRRHMKKMHDMDSAAIDESLKGVRPVWGAESDTDRPYGCHLCDATYVNRRHLISHMKQHQGQTCCPLCQKTFSARYNMRRHMVINHDLTKEQVDMLIKINVETMTGEELTYTMDNLGRASGE